MKINNDHVGNSEEKLTTNCVPISFRPPEDAIGVLVGKLEREKNRLGSYKVGSKEYNNSYKLIAQLKEDIVERACVLFSPYYKTKKAIKVENKEEN